MFRIMSLRRGVRRDMSLNRECSLYCFIMTAFHRGCRMQTARSSAYRVPTLGRHTTSFVCRHGQNYRCEVGRSGWPMLWTAKTDLSTREAMMEIRFNRALENWTCLGIPNELKCWYEDTPFLNQVIVRYGVVFLWRSRLSYLHDHTCSLQHY